MRNPSFRVLPFALLFLLMLYPATLHAQEGDHSLDGGAWALQFGVAESFTLGSFEGSTISAKHHTSASRAFRYGLSFSGAHRNVDEDFTQSNWQLALSTHFLSYPTLSGDPNGTIQMFWGIGPNLSYGMQRVTPEGADADTEHTLGLGAGGTIGVEWFVLPRISLSGEYQTNLLVEWMSEEWRIGLQNPGVRFGVSVYF